MVSKIELNKTLAVIVRDAILRAAGFHQFGRLQDSFRFLANAQGVRIFSIYYWVRFVNDGRPAISLQKPKQMIFYLDPSQDPRLNGDYPKRQSKRRRLTSAEFKRDKAAGRLIVTQHVRETEPKRFIEAGIREARTLVPKKVLESIRGDVRKLIRRRRDSITVVL